ncbi:hypothetical protein Bhyg_07743, partial [Pseudolycoriella hygida]
INGDRRLKKGAVPSLCLSDVLLIVKTEHDYALSPKEKHWNAVFNFSNSHDEIGSHISTNGSGNSKSFFFDVIDVSRSSGVGANVDNLLYENRDRLQDQLRNTTKYDYDQVVAKTAQELLHYKKKCEEYSKLDEWTDENVVKYLSNKFNKQQLEFFKMQIFNSGKNINGRRYNDNQKSLSLSIHKQSPKNYHFLRRFLILPGKTTLGRHRAHLVFQSGIDPRLMNIVKLKVKELTEKQKISTLSWDEVSLKPHIDYNRSRDIIDGFVDVNGSRRPEFATHALTFMVRGIHTPFKEPVSYYYTANLNGIELSEAVRMTNEAVVDTVCDQPSPCVAAVHNLIRSNQDLRTCAGQLLTYNINGND